MSAHLDRELVQIRANLVDQFGRVEQMLQLSVRALMERRSDFVSKVIESDSIVDAADIRIEEECLKLLALHQPVATDLRWLITVVKINSEIERMADLACNIAERAQSLDLFPFFPVPEEMSEMAVAATDMVRNALDAFIERDANKAADVIRSDELVDTLNRVVIDQLHAIMKEDSDQIEPAIHCFSASRHLERVGDLAENISEEVIYLVDGEIVRHNHSVFID